MSLTPVTSPSAKITPNTLLERKQAHQPITALTAYDYATARLADEAGIDLLLVGNSLAMVVMGLESTLPVTVDEMLHHTRAVRRGVRRAMLVADMPYGSYHLSVDEGVANAVRFVKDGGAEAVKVEGARAGVGGTPGGSRDPGGWAHRADATVGASHGRLQGAGEDRC